jgi:2-amino-4-hydroxy-6-hydroxymethyldihydropteridine diphosphokinase
VRYFIGLGSNLGDRLATLRSAVTALSAHGAVLARSRVFASSPVGGPPQPPYLNAALLLESPLAPLDLLHACQAVERQLGRVREAEIRWGPRTLDVDLLLAGAHGEVRVDTPELTVPHALLHERAFALGPLVDLDDRLMHPTVARPLKSLLHAAQSLGHVIAPTGEHL